MLKDNYKPIDRGDVGSLSNDEWLKCRLHGTKMTKTGKPMKNPVHAEPGDPGYIEYTLGGSDIAVAAGISNFSSPLQLYGKKKGLYTPQAPSNPEQLQMGHDMESIAAIWFARKTGATIINDTHMYQHPKYPWALADMDRRFVLPDGRRGILEIKTTSFYCKNQWDDEGYPEKYEYQLRYYMGIDNCNLGAFICLWGMNPANDMAIRFIDRDKEKEKMIFQIGENFIERLKNDDPPSNDGISTEQAVEAIADMYKGDKNAADVEFAPSYATSFEKMVQFTDEIAQHKDRIKKLEEKRDSIFVKLAEIMKNAETGIVTAENGDKYLLNYPVKTRTSVDSKLLKKDYPEIYEEVSKTTSKRGNYTVKKV